MPFLLLLVLACGGAPLSIRHLEPDRVEPGQQVRLVGRGFTPEVRVRMGSAELVGAEVLDEHTITGFVPDLSEGGWDLEVIRGDERDLLPAGAHLLPRVDPCDPGYQRNTTLSLSKEEVEVRRFFPDGGRETVLWSVDQVHHLELELGEDCQALFLWNDAGERLLYDASPSERLDARAERLGVTLGRPVRRTERR